MIVTHGWQLQSVNNTRKSPLGDWVFSVLGVSRRPSDGKVSEKIDSPFLRAPVILNDVLIGRISSFS